MKVVFLGTPNFAKNCLERLLQSKHQVLAVVCAHDKKQGRGQKLTPPPVKTFALKHNIPVYQFSKIRLEGVETLKSLNPDIMVTAAFGQILSQEILNIAKFGVINVHGSILPKYRGAAPVQYALLNGETKTGVSIMKTQVGIDDGPVLLTKEVDIDPTDNTETLMEKLSVIGGELLVEALDLIESGRAIWTEQDHEKATFTKMLKKEKSQIDFNQTPNQIVNFVRAYAPNPCATFNYNDMTFKVYFAKVADFNQNENLINGTVVCANSKKGLIVKCQDGFVEIELLQAPSSKIMRAKDYLNGKKIEVGSVLN